MSSTASFVQHSADLYDLADNLRAERSLWKHPAIRSELTHAIRTIEEAARHALAESEAYGDAWLLEGTHHLQKYVSWRRFIDSMGHDTANPHAFFSLHCRDGRHHDCANCGCPHHRKARP